MAEFSQAIFDTICERIADGESLRAICRDDGMITTSNFFRWIEADADRAERYARAREASADADADDVTDIGKRTLRGEFDPQAARVAIDALKWSAGKRKPKVYGDKVDLSGDVGFSVTIARDDADL